jgi:hypothetical protein
MVALALEVTMDLGRADGNPARYLAGYTPTDDLLDVADAILQQGGPWPPTDELDFSGEKRRRDAVSLIVNLEQVLYAGSSFVRLNDTHDGLTRRVDATVTAAFDSTVLAVAGKSNVGSAANQIRNAWKELYGVKPDPSAAYSAAIKALESAAHAVVEPKNSKATLGTMIGVLKGAPHKYQLVLPGPSGNGDIEVLIKMLELIWTGQTSRHGAQTVTRAETQEEAEMAVHLAVTLMQWFATGSVAHKP